MKSVVWALTVLLVLCATTLGVLVHNQAAAERGTVDLLHSGATAETGTDQTGTARGQIAQTLGEFTPLDAPRPAPDISFSSPDGQILHLGAFRGHVVLVNLWATWCGPCVHEMPSLDRLQAKLGDDLTILAIAEDRRGAAVVEPFLAKLGLKSLAAYLDPENAASHAFSIEGLPTSYLIDRDGRIVGSLEGSANWDSAPMIALIRHYATPRDPVQRASVTR